MAERKAPKKEPSKTPKKKPSGKVKPKPKSKPKPKMDPVHGSSNLPAIPISIGRRKLYKSEYDEQAFKYALLGADDKRMADLFEVHLATFYRWKNDYPSFCEAIKAGKEDADANIVNSMYYKAKGYQEIKISKFKDPNGVEIIKEETVNHPPDTMCMMYWLNNRQRKQFKSKNEEIEAAKLDLEIAKMKFDQEIQLAKLELEKQKLELAKIKASMGTEDEVESDGFIEALNDSASDAFEDFEDVE